MELHDFDGGTHIHDEADLLARLRSHRRGSDAAFILSHGDDSLWVHLHGDTAFLWYLPGRDGTHPGFVPDGMWAGPRVDVRFLLPGGSAAGTIEVVWEQLVSPEVAYRAAAEYLHSPGRPASVSWFEL